MTKSDPIISRAVDSVVSSVRSLVKLILFKILSPTAYFLWSLIARRKIEREENFTTPNKKPLIDRVHAWREKRRKKRTQ